MILQSSFYVTNERHQMKSETVKKKGGGGNLVDCSVPKTLLKPAKLSKLRSCSVFYFYLFVRMQNRWPKAIRKRLLCVHFTSFCKCALLTVVIACIHWLVKCVCLSSRQYFSTCGKRLNITGCVACHPGGMLACELKEKRQRLKRSTRFHCNTVWTWMCYHQKLNRWTKRGRSFGQWCLKEDVILKWLSTPLQIVAKSTTFLSSTMLMQIWRKLFVSLTA